MAPNTIKDFPPSYEARNDKSLDEFTATVQRTVAQHRNLSESDATEVSRMRSFLLFCLCIDYRHPIEQNLSAEDSRHFVRLDHMIGYLTAIDDKFVLLESERHEIAAYLWRFIHEPCRALGVPVECVISTLMHFRKFQDKYATFKGSAYGVLHTEGLGPLADKLWLDTKVVIPRLLPSPDAQASMIRRVNELADFYFSSIEGVEGSICPPIGRAPFSQTQTVSYTLTERGRKYEKARHSAISTARTNSKLSPAHIYERLMQSMPWVPGKISVFPTPDMEGQWREISQSRKKQGFLRYPSGWT